jgi:hypothetical protein
LKDSRLGLLLNNPSFQLLPQPKPAASRVVAGLGVCCLHTHRTQWGETMEGQNPHGEERQTLISALKSANFWLRKKPRNKEFDFHIGTFKATATV